MPCQTDFVSGNQVLQETPGRPPVPLHTRQRHTSTTTLVEHIALIPSRCVPPSAARPPQVQRAAVPHLPRPAAGAGRALAQR